MEQPSIINSFTDKDLNPDQYFEYFLREIMVRKLLTPQEVLNIQGALQELITEQVRKYTSGESSSVRVEIAENLLHSVYYCLGISLKRELEMETRFSLLKNYDSKDLFLEGIERIKEQVADAKTVFHEVKEKRLLVHNYAYEDTIMNGLDTFFTEYNPRFAANDTPCSIDYPLSQDIMNFTGIEYMRRYLGHLNIENKFCSYFSNEAIEAVLRGYSKYYQEDLLNIYEIVLGNGIARILSDNDLSELSVEEDDRQAIEKLLRRYDRKELEAKLYKTFQFICSNMDFTEVESDYLKKAIQPLSVRIKHSLEHGCLDKIFITGKEYIEEETYSYCFRKQMDNKTLRAVISEIKDCRFVSDKIAMLKRKVNNLDDLTEILEECFWEEEYQEVFALLSEYELSILRERIAKEQEYGGFEYEEGSWKKALLAYGK